ncbi:Bax inhibitor-1/YccA family protein [Apilactobacillus apisilvae]|uniref:Bax inhibitor-1/YccA family protein n=1 Tax=Apilactobacillus apisilvae TaxID=2923364 RepID=A0ABY4PI07_9LACO|nr:Bax inhibitor-1/YccA family protein [Apilactobacillus apisilvae]UQS85262.1 Bax inhibitor-1/YccA family protein [Apilactobacillus apisilvae]
MNDYDQTNRRLVNNSFGMNKFLTKTYGWMALSVLISGIVSYLVGSVYHTTLALVPSIVGIVIWLVLAYATSKVAMNNSTLGFIMFIAFSALTGGLYSYIFLAYSATVITQAFLTATVDFAVMSFIGITTKRSLDKIGTQATGALIALIIVSIINAFLRVPFFSFVISVIAVIIFTILIAYDSQKIKELYNEHGSEVSENGLAINGAMALYLDFINLFLQLLSIFGGNDRD